MPPSSPVIPSGERNGRAVDMKRRETGIIGEKFPGMDMLSFGPEIRSPHAPGEKVQISSVEKTWRLLKAFLAELA